jgi:hypothetical protein
MDLSLKNFTKLYESDSYSIRLLDTINKEIAQQHAEKTTKEKEHKLALEVANKIKFKSQKPSHREVKDKF